MFSRRIFSIENQSDSKYAKRWADYREAKRARRSPFIRIVITFAIVAVLGLALAIHENFVLLIPVFLLIGAFSKFRQRAQEPGMLLCPRCEEHFFGIFGSHMHRFTRRCVNCGLEKWAVADPGPRPVKDDLRDHRRAFLVVFFYMFLPFLALSMLWRWALLIPLTVSGVQVQGTIIETFPREHCTCSYSYFVDGVQYQGSGNSCCELRVGESALISYLPSNPRRSVNGEPLKLLLGDWLGVVIGLPIFVLIGVVMASLRGALAKVLKSRPGPRK